MALVWSPRDRRQGGPRLAKKEYLKAIVALGSSVGTVQKGTLVLMCMTKGQRENPLAHRRKGAARAEEKGENAAAPKEQKTAAPPRATNAPLAEPTSRILAQRVMLVSTGIHLLADFSRRTIVEMVTNAFSFMRTSRHQQVPGDQNRPLKKGEIALHVVVPLRHGAKQEASLRPQLPFVWWLTLR